MRKKKRGAGCKHQIISAYTCLLRITFTQAVFAKLLSAAPVH